VLPALVLLAVRWHSRIDRAAGGAITVATSHSPPG